MKNYNLNSREKFEPGPGFEPWLLYLIDEINNPVVTLKTIGQQWYWRNEYSNVLKVRFDSYISSGIAIIGEDAQTQILRLRGLV